MKLLDVLTAPWAIEPGKLLEIQAIYLAHARGEKADLAAIEARLGRPLANERAPYVVDQGVAVLSVEGVIAKRANMFSDISGGVSTQLLERDLQAALHDPAVHSIILSTDSPGGSVDGTQALAAKVRTGTAHKPIVTLASGMIASAAYWIGSASSAVYLADGTTVSGSIGVVANHADYSKQRAERGVKVTEITAGKYKRIASDNAPLSKEGLQYMQAQVDYYYSLFVNDVATQRGASVDTVLADMADGRIFIGQQGVDAGLADGIQSMAQVIALLNADYSASLADASHVRGSGLPRARLARGGQVEQVRNNVHIAITPGANHTAVAAAVNAQIGRLVNAAKSDSKANPIFTGAHTMDRATLAAEHPELLTAILDEGRAAGATAERERLAAIDGAAIPGHEALVAKLKADGTVSAGDAALQILAAERTARVQAGAQRAAEAPQPLTLVPSATVAPTAAELAAAAAAEADAGLSVEDRSKKQWEADASLRAEFGSLDAYTAFAKAQDRGAVRMLVNKKG